MFDFGVNYAGWFNFTLDGSGRRGERIEFWPGEMLKADGSIDQASTGKDIYDAYMVAGHESEYFTPQFMYHGNQYIAVSLQSVWRGCTGEQVPRL